jgi:hypothetical protein
LHEISLKNHADNCVNQVPTGHSIFDFVVLNAILSSVSKQDKNITAMRNNPRDWRIEQLESVAALAGLKVRKNGGSHVVFQRDSCPLEVCVPARKPIKAVYVVQLLALIDWSPE